MHKPAARASASFCSWLFVGLPDGVLGVPDGDPVGLPDAVAVGVLPEPGETAPPLNREPMFRSRFISDQSTSASDVFHSTRFGSWGHGCHGTVMNWMLSRPMFFSELPSEATVPGALQVPPDGRPILFGPDAPVTGGYPVLGVVRTADLDVAAQLRPGDTVRFVVA